MTDREGSESNTSNILNVSNLVMGGIVFIYKRLENLDNVVLHVFNFKIWSGVAIDFGGGSWVHSLLSRYYVPKLGF